MLWLAFTPALCERSCDSSLNVCAILECFKKSHLFHVVLCRNSDAAMVNGEYYMSFDRCFKLARNAVRLYEVDFIVRWYKIKEVGLGLCTEPINVLSITSILNRTLFP